MASTQASRITKLETHDVAVKLPAQRFHELFTTKVNQISKACPHRIRSVELLEGHSGKEGCILLWKYTAPDDSNKVHYTKDLVDVIDYKNMFNSYKVIEGELLNVYKSFRFLFQVTPKADGGSMAKWSVEYEKKNEDTPDAHAFIPYLVDFTKEVDAYYSNKA